MAYAKFIVFDSRFQAVMSPELIHRQAIELVDQIQFFTLFVFRVASRGVMFATPDPEGVKTEPW